MFVAKSVPHGALGAYHTFATFFVFGCIPGRYASIAVYIEKMCFSMNLLLFSSVLCSEANIEAIAHLLFVAAPRFSSQKVWSWSSCEILAKTARSLHQAGVQAITSSNSLRLEPCRPSTDESQEAATSYGWLMAFCNHRDCRCRRPHMRRMAFERYK